MTQHIKSLIIEIQKRTNASLNEINRAILMFEDQGYNNDWISKHIDTISRYIELRAQAVARYKIVDGEKVSYGDIDYINLAIKNTEG